MNLTKEEIEQLEAGPALDALIAEHVFKLEVSGHYTRTHWGNQPDGFPRGTSSMPIPAYSTDIAAAALLTERMATLGFWMKVHSPYEPGEPWWCSFDTHGISDSRPPWQASATTESVARCKSALLTTFS